MLLFAVRPSEEQLILESSQEEVLVDAVHDGSAFSPACRRVSINVGKKTITDLCEAFVQVHFSWQVSDKVDLSACCGDIKLLNILQMDPRRYRHAIIEPEHLPSMDPHLSQLLTKHFIHTVPNCLLLLTCLLLLSLCWQTFMLLV